MSLFISGVATFIQVHKVGPVGSGLLSIQGTSFAFVGTLVTVGTAAVARGPLAHPNPGLHSHDLYAGGVC